MREAPLFPPTKNTPQEGPRIKKIHTARKYSQKQPETPIRPLEEIRVTVVSKLDPKAATPLVPSRISLPEPTFIRKAREPKEGYLPWSMIVLVVALSFLATYQLFSLSKKSATSAQTTNPEETFKLPDVPSVQ